MQQQQIALEKAHAALQEARELFYGLFGQHSTAQTDAKLDAEIFSYSKSKGLFAGISLSGSVLDIDNKANRNYYDGQVNATQQDDVYAVPFEEITLKRTLRQLFK